MGVASMTNPGVPGYARLEAGITGDDLLGAINKSGYPFQAEVADRVRSEFSDIEASAIQEEWAYIDQESDVVRSLDIFAQIPLSVPGDSSWSQISGRCHQSWF
jgi:hypothetical protein